MILIGTIHIDLNGPKRLETILNRFRPKKVSIEWPCNIDLREVVNQIQANKQSLLQQLRKLKLDLPSNVLDLMYEENEARGYEFIVPNKYCTRNGLELLCVDHPAISDEREFKIPESLPQNPYEEVLRELYSQLSSEVISELKNVPYDEFKKRYSKLLDKAYWDSDFLDELDKQIPQWYQQLYMNFLGPYLNDPVYIEEREKFMAEKLLSLKPDIHIGGAGHIFEGGYPIEEAGVVPLFKRIGDSQIIRLCEADSL